MKVCFCLQGVLSAPYLLVNINKHPKREWRDLLLTQVLFFASFTRKISYFLLLFANVTYTDMYTAGLIFSVCFVAFTNSFQQVFASFSSIRHLPSTVHRDNNSAWFSLISVFFFVFCNRSTRLLVLFFLLTFVLFCFNFGFLNVVVRSYNR